jgi:hypothetical protein
VFLKHLTLYDFPQYFLYLVHLLNTVYLVEFEGGNGGMLKVDSAI